MTSKDVITGEVGRKRMAELPLGRFGQPEEIADAVVFLLSDASSLFLGQTLGANSGGLML
jgi:3-oxoacyl-[acyl-carrier protein] reductase